MIKSLILKTSVEFYMFILTFPLSPKLCTLGSFFNLIILIISQALVFLIVPFALNYNNIESNADDKFDNAANEIMLKPQLHMPLSKLSAKVQFFDGFVENVVNLRK